MVLPLFCMCKLVGGVGEDFVANKKGDLELETAEYISIVAPFLPSNPYILEAGAHSGEDTVLFARNWPEARIFAFEPVPKFFGRIVRSLSLKDIMFVKGISENPNQPVLFCMELSKPRFQVLQQRDQNNPQVVCYNVSAVPLEEFPTEKEIYSFMNSVDNELTQYGQPEVIRWLRQDIDYVISADVPTKGIELIKSDQGN